MYFGKNLKALRKKNNISSTEMAKLFNTTRFKIELTEHNKIKLDIDFLIQTSKHFNISTDELLFSNDIVPKKIIKHKLGYNLKSLRKKSSLTQQQVSDALNINRASLAYYEINYRMPNKKRLKEISEFYNTTVENLLHGNH